MKLKAPGLFRQQCYVDGAWIDAESGATVDVTNPADGSVLDREGSTYGVDDFLEIKYLCPGEIDS